MSALSVLSKKSESAGPRASRSATPAPRLRIGQADDDLGQIRNEQRAQENAKAIEKLRSAGAKSPPPPQAPSQPSQLLPAPGTPPPQPSFNPLPGAPGPSPIDQAQRVVAEAKRQTLELIARGEKLLSGSPSDADIAAFKQDDWRARITLIKNHFTDNGPDIGRAGMDEVLNSDQYGGRLSQIRQNFGG